MKLVALKRLSDRRPVGCVFEEPNPRAKMLVYIGAAKPYVEEVKAVAEPAPPVPQVIEPVVADESPYTPTVSDKYVVTDLGRGRGSRGRRA